MIQRKSTGSKRRAWLFERLEDRRCLAIEAQLASNINRTDPWSSVSELASVGSLLYFIAREPGATQFDLWRTNDTKAGTIRLASNVASNAGSPPHLMTAVNGSLFFRGFDDVHGYELWKSDGSVAGTRMVKDLTPGPGNSQLSELMEYNGKLLFLANGDLTISDGTEAGTVQVQDFVAGASDGILELELHAGEVYFNPDSGFSGLWKTNGQVGSAVSLESGEIVVKLTSVGDKLFFTKDFSELWKTNGQPNAAELVDDAIGYQINSVNVNGELYYDYFGSLGKSDGTASGTTTIKSLNSISNMFNFNGQLFFAGEDSNGIELWTSDGTVAGTFMVKDLFPGKPVDDFFPNSSHPSNFTAVNGKLYFAAANKLWTTNGTELGTQPVFGGGVESLTGHNGSLYYGQGTLKKLDTVTSKSTSIQRLGSGVGSSFPSNVVELNGQYFLAADDGITGNELRRLNADGSTTLVRDIWPGSEGSIFSATPALTSFNGSIYFSAVDPINGAGLWISDGTTGGTKFLSNVEARTDFDSGNKFLAVGNTLYFNGLSADGFELWKTDGTVAGTVMVKDINPGSYPTGVLNPKSSRPSNLFNFNGTLFFNAADGDGVRRLWKSDGTSAGTDLALGREIFNVSPLVVKNNQLYFTAKDASNGALWKSDGTLAGTERLFGGEIVRVGNSPELTLLNGQFYFVGDNNTYGAELWKSDGTPAGTKLVKDIFVGPVGSFFTTKLYNFNNRLYFQARAQDTGAELWQSDGTATGTVIVQDINPGPNGSLVTNLTNLNGTIYFLAQEIPFEPTLWRTNGTAAGASRVSSNASGPAFKFPSSLSLANERLFFSADSVWGNELFTVTPVSPTILSTNTSIAYREGTSRIFLASAATLTDTDTPILNGGKVTVNFKSPYLAGDQLFVNAIPSLSIVNNSVRFNNVAFGTISGGLDGQPLSISLNSSASVIAVQTLLRGLAFRSDSRNPSAVKRTVQIALRDGEGGAAVPLLVTIAMIRVNDTPTFNNLPTSQSYKLNAAPISVTPLATVSDVDNPNFNGGQLVVTAFGGEVTKNRLQFTGGLFSVDASLNVIYKGTTIGKVNLNGGRNNIPLRITFNSNAKLNVVSELLQSIKFSTVGSTLTATRRVTFAVSDGAGGSKTASINIAVSR